MVARWGKKNNKCTYYLLPTHYSKILELVLLKLQFVGFRVFTFAYDNKRHNIRNQL